MTYHLLPILRLPPYMSSSHRLDLLVLLPRARSHNVCLHKSSQIPVCPLLPITHAVCLCAKCCVLSYIFPRLVVHLLYRAIQRRKDGAILTLVIKAALHWVNVASEASEDVDGAFIRDDV